MTQKVAPQAPYSNPLLKVNVSQKALAQEFGPLYAITVAGAAGYTFGLTAEDPELDLHNLAQVTRRAQALSEIQGMRTAAAMLLAERGHEHYAAIELAGQHIAELTAAMTQDSKDAHIGTPGEYLVTIDEMITLLREMLTRSPLGGDTVLYWSEQNRPVVPVSQVRLEIDDDRATVEISPQNSEPGLAFLVEDEDTVELVAQAMFRGGFPHASWREAGDAGQDVWRSWARFAVRALIEHARVTSSVSETARETTT